MMDTYLKSKNKDALAALVVEGTNALPICQGRAAQNVVDEEGTAISIPPCGNSAFFYTCIRAPDPVAASDDVEVCSQEEAAPVCGVWA